MVKKKSRKSQARKRKGSWPMLIGERIFRLLESMGGNRQKARLAEVWEKWPQVVGEELAELASPAGHKEHTLILSAEDAMTIQEARMREEEFLDRVNSFLQTAYFEKLRVELGHSRKKGKSI